MWQALSYRTGSSLLQMAPEYIEVNLHIQKFGREQNERSGHTTADGMLLNACCSNRIVQASELFVEAIFKEKEKRKRGGVYSPTNSHVSGSEMLSLYLPIT